MSIVEPLCNLCTIKKCSATFMEPSKVDVLVIVDSPDRITVGAPKICPMLNEVKKVVKPFLEKYSKTAKITFGVSCPTLNEDKEHRSFNALEFAACYPRLSNEIRECNPDTILLIGDFSEAYPLDAENKPENYMYTRGFQEFDIPVIAVPNVLRPSKSFAFGQYQLLMYGVEKAVRGPSFRFETSDEFSYILHPTVESFMPYYRDRVDDFMSIDIETFGPEDTGLNPRAHIITCLGMRLDGINHIIEAGGVAHGKELLTEVLTDEKLLKIGANLLYEDRSFKHHIGCHLANPWDIQLVEYGAIREVGPYKLEFLARLYTDCKGWKDDVDYGIINETLYQYLARDLVYTEDVYKAQSAILAGTS